MQFVKMHGAGNDFVLVDLLQSGTSQEDAYWAAVARKLCDRHFGIGADGLLLVLPSTAGDARMRMFNPDGSESMSCGNGIRCLGRYVHDRYRLGRPELRVETGAGPTTISIAEGGQVTVDMGPPILVASDIPVRGEGPDGAQVNLTLDGRDLQLTCASMGNPHAVLFVGSGELEAFPLEQLGPQVEHDAHFPARTNFEVCEVVGPEHMRIRVWERGAGITLACGTGACASVVVATRAGRVRPPVQVDLPGGRLRIVWDGVGPVFMTGPTDYVFTGTVSLEALQIVGADSRHQTAATVTVG